MPADAPALRVDAHHHFWRYADGYCAWMADAPAILHRDYLPADLAPALKAAGIAGTVVVQAAETPVETDWLLALAREVPWVWGVVGWLDPADAGAVARAEAWRATGQLAGIRLWYQDDADGERLHSVIGAPLLSWAAAHDMPIDLLIRPRHLSAAVALVDASPDVRFVVDHGAKPDIARWPPDAEERLQWWDAMDRLARHRRVCCKLSGMVTEAATDYTPDSLKPYSDALLQLFGPARLLWGSDWPVALSASSYAGWVACTDRLIGHLSAPERAAILGANAIRFYGLTPRH
ncbi:amidohydrolase family protein [Sphingomonas flavalba]|uniref:amidohydrolase family protein n=1 Tax=Sphingomonas flavalba TaxID=2559804 RepID=UPI00109D9DF7|nr:amidohydrolase family protein [Sphingomonas flavalba]